MSRFVWRNCRALLLSRAGSTLALAFLLALSTLMCTPDRSAPVEAPTATAQAAATSARRTSVANVQRMLSGDVVPTATPEPTSAPRPTCPDAIWWFEAGAHIGESRVIEGTILRTRAAPEGNVLLELGQPYPDPTGFTVLVPAEAGPGLAGKTVCVQGRILNRQGAPTIVERDPATITVLN